MIVNESYRHQSIATERDDLFFGRTGYCRDMHRVNRTFPLTCQYLIDQQSRYVLKCVACAAGRIVHDSSLRLAVESTASVQGAKNGLHLSLFRFSCSFTGDFLIENGFLFIILKF